MTQVLDAISNAIWFLVFFTAFCLLVFLSINVWNMGVLISEQLSAEVDTCYSQFIHNIKNNAQLYAVSDDISGEDNCKIIKCLHEKGENLSAKQVFYLSSC